MSAKEGLEDVDVMRHEGTGFNKTGWGLEPVFIPVEVGLPHPLHASYEAYLLTGLYIWSSSSNYIVQGVTKQTQQEYLVGLNTGCSCKRDGVTYQGTHHLHPEATPRKL